MEPKWAFKCSVFRHPLIRKYNVSVDREKSSQDPTTRWQAVDNGHKRRGDPGFSSIFERCDPNPKKSAQNSCKYSTNSRIREHVGETQDLEQGEGIRNANTIYSCKKYSKLYFSKQ